MRTPHGGLGRRDFSRLLGGAGLAARKPAAAPIVITEARLYHLQAPVPQPVKTSFGTMTARHLVLLELRDELVAVFSA